MQSNSNRERTSVKLHPILSSFTRLSVSIFFFFNALFSLDAQHNSLAIEGGYAKNYSNSFQGWKINGLYEYHPKNGKFLYGIAVGYLRTSKRVTVSSGGVNYEYVINTIPLAIAPKFLIGNGSLRGFVKADLGFQFTTRKILDSSVNGTNASGFYGGLGAGILKSFGPKYFVQISYEMDWLESTFYGNDLELLNAILIGVGSRFE